VEVPVRWQDCRIVAFDTETTGLNWPDGDRIIEFAAVELQLDGRGEVRGVEVYNQLFNPEIPIPKEASKVNGITDDKVADEPLFAEAAKEVAARLEGAILIAQNLPFDYGFIRMELERAGRSWPRTVAEVDTLPLAMQLLPHLQSYRLGSLCEAMGVSLEGAHRASNDAEATGRLLLELAKRKGAPDALPGFIEWADAIAPPPDTGHLKLGPRGVVELCEEPWAGRTVEELPDILQWMTMALQRQGGAWTHRYPAPVRQWARRWLRLRASGSAKPATARPAPGAASAGSGLLGGGASRAAVAEGGLRRGNPAEWNLEPSPWLRWSAGSA
jgi:DNA polymerase III epsilon subunit family exonuclease